MKTRRQLVDTRHGQMHIRTVGEGGTPLVLLHSQVVAGRWFDLALPGLAADRLVVLPDRIGYGDSDPLPRSLTFAEFADATVDGLAQLGIDNADFAGIHSGSIEAVEIATAHPAVVNRLALITVSVFDESERSSFKELFGPPKAPADDGSHLLESWGWWYGARPAGVPLEIVQGWALDHLIASPNYWWTFVQAIDYPLGEKLPLITQPVLALLPHDDVALQSQRSIALLPAHAQVVDMPHITQVMAVFTTHVDEIVERLRGFFA